VPGLVVATERGGTEPALFEDRPAQADLLVLGGDEVYPVASATAYEERLNEVFRAAANIAEIRHSPPVVALPGNHDWYDGLAAFRRNFCESWVLRGHRYVPSLGPTTTDVPAPENRDDVGGWGAFQSRSYFAVQLSPQWWLWGLDSQLDAPIDAEQLAYFHEARTLLGEADVILCTAAPSWLEAHGPRAYSAMADTPLYTLLWFVDRVLGEQRDRVRLVLTGDKHHYARYRPTSRTPDTAGGLAPELVTCGGGGAFLSSTHHLPQRLAPVWQPWPTGSGAVGHYERAATYPGVEESRKLTATPRFLAAGWRNGWSLPAFTGAVDVLLALGLLLERPWLFWIPTVVLGALFGLYATSGAKEIRPAWRKRMAVGLLLVGHLAAHVGVALLVAFLVRSLGPPGAVLMVLIAFLLCTVLGTTVFVTYLHVADWFGAHTLEAFSAMRFEGHKSHLRLRVGPDRITGYVIAMDTVPRARRVRQLREKVPHPYVVDVFTVASRRAAATTSDTAAPDVMIDR
jgi:hypothetical protein